MTVAWTAGTLAVPLFLGDIFAAANELRVREDAAMRSDMHRNIYKVMGFAGCLPLITMVRMGCTGIAGERFLKRIRLLLFAVLLDQPIAFFDESLSGEIVNRMAADTEVLHMFVSTALPDLVYGVLLMTTCFVVMMYVDWRLTLDGQ